jgi:hypothetical protein
MWFPTIWKAGKHAQISVMRLGTVVRMEIQDATKFPAAWAVTLPLSLPMLQLARLNVLEPIV